jgi:type II secretory pathway component GspD/PulD (secretin)
VQANGTQAAANTFNSQAFNNTAATGAPFNGSVISLMQQFQAAGLSLNASFQLLADNGLIRVVSAPRMTVAAGQTGYLLAGQELPIQSASFVNNVLQTSTTYKPVGVQLYITPQAVGPDRVKLHTISIVSSVSGFSPLPTITGQTGANTLINPIIDSREAETAVTIDDGSTLVISGLRMIRTTTREEKVPGLGDIPVLGWMFKNHRSQQQMTDLYFFVTPTLM